MHSLEIDGCFLIEDSFTEDSRGFFRKSFLSTDFTANNLNPDWAESAIAFTKNSGTMRGLHIQTGFGATEKLVTPVTGKIHDIILDLRKHSPTYLKSITLDLSADSKSSIYIPKGIAHGYQTLEDNTSISYLISAPYNPKYYKGVNYLDPLIKIELPIGVSNISIQDQNWPLLSSGLDSGAFSIS
jgi:dTDP-4-dehydrorhamnose 3,5-epimerase